MAKNPEWKSAPQPFRRRALIAASYQNKLYVIGGFDDKNKIVQDVSVFDPRSAQWSEVPKLPAGPGLTFAPAATVHKGALYATVSDGALLRLNESSHAWEKVGSSTGRVAHRMISHRGSALSIGAAAGGNNLDLIESLAVSQ